MWQTCNQRVCRRVCKMEGHAPCDSGRLPSPTAMHSPTLRAIRCLPRRQMHLRLWPRRGRPALRARWCAQRARAGANRHGAPRHGLRVQFLRLGHHLLFPGLRYLHTRPASRVRGCPRCAAADSRHDEARRTMERHACALHACMCYGAACMCAPRVHVLWSGMHVHSTRASHQGCMCLRACLDEGGWTGPSGARHVVTSAAMHGTMQHAACCPSFSTHQRRPLSPADAPHVCRDSCGGSPLPT